MSENLIAIILYIGILLMAGTVLVLTIIYFVKPAAGARSAAVSGDDATAALVPVAVPMVSSSHERSCETPG